MSVLMRWIQKKLYSYWHWEDRVEQHDEQEKQGKQEQPQNTCGREGQPQMVLTLHDLQRTMDPLIAAQVYNNSHSLLTRLPEELLLCILHYIGDDMLTLFCLRRVSRVFRRLIYEPDIWKYMYEPEKWNYMSNPFPRMFAYLDETGWDVPIDNKLRQRLQRDGMCDKCILWCDVSVKGWFGQIIEAFKGTRDGFLGCKFQSQLGSGLHYDACDSHRDVLAFPPSKQQPDKRERRCLGCQGAVQLCEHIHISWAAIETHITNWQRRKPEDWKACFDHFDVECHDPSHDTRCTAEEAPTWPRARLQSAASNKNLVVLNLEWKPHSGLHAFTLTPDGRAPASELRALFQRYRQGVADILLPSYPSNPLPEMACFGPTKCGCLHYEKGDNKRPSAADLSNHASFFFGDDRTCGCRGGHKYNRDHGYGQNGQRIDMGKHWPMGTCNSVCLVTTYQRDVLVCHKIDRNKIKPTHEWFHAMDPETYPRRRANYGLPLCKDKGCMNYYRRPKFFKCSYEDFTFGFGFLHSLI